MIVPLTRCLLSALVVAVAAGPAAAAENEGDAVLRPAGSRDYQVHCAACHGVEGRGDGPVAVVLVTRPADLTRIAARRDGEFPAGEIARMIDGRLSVTAHGPREMPVWGRIFASLAPDTSTGEEVARGRIEALVEYLRSIQVEGEGG